MPIPFLQPLRRRANQEEEKDCDNQWLKYRFQVNNAQDANQKQYRDIAQSAQFNSAKSTCLSSTHERFGEVSPHQLLAAHWSERRR